MCPTGDRNKNKSAISVRSDKYKFAISISSAPYTRDLNKHKFVTRTIRYVNMLYEFMKIMIFVYVICLL